MALDHNPIANLRSESVRQMVRNRLFDSAANRRDDTPQSPARFQKGQEVTFVKYDVTLSGPITRVYWQPFMRVWSYDVRTTLETFLVLETEITTPAPAIILYPNVPLLPAPQFSGRCRQVTVGTRTFANLHKVWSIDIEREIEREMRRYRLAQLTATNGYPSGPVIYLPGKTMRDEIDAWVHAVNQQAKHLDTLLLDNTRLSNQTVSACLADENQRFVQIAQSGPKGTAELPVIAGLLPALCANPYVPPATTILQPGPLMHLPAKLPAKNEVMVIGWGRGKVEDYQRQKDLFLVRNTVIPGLTRWVSPTQIRL